MAQFLDFPYENLELGALHSPLTASDAAANARLDEYCALATKTTSTLDFNLSKNTRDNSPMASMSPESLTTPSSVSANSPNRSRQCSAESMIISPAPSNSRRVNNLMGSCKINNPSATGRKSKKMKTPSGSISVGCALDPTASVYIRNSSPVSSNNSFSAILPNSAIRSSIPDALPLHNPFSISSGDAGPHLTSLTTPPKIKSTQPLSRHNQVGENPVRRTPKSEPRAKTWIPENTTSSHSTSSPNMPIGLFGPSWSSVPANTPPPFTINPDSTPRLFFGPMNTKTRVETQLEFPIILCPVPSSLARLQLPRSAVSKPKFFGKPEPQSPSLLHLFTYVVCTSAMENTYYRRCALLRARGETKIPHPTPAERQILESERNRRNREDPFNLDLAQNGGQVKICAGCIQRERKRATRTKKPQTDLSKEWDSYEQNRIIVFNLPEYQDWKPLDRDDDELCQLPPTASCVKITMRISCYCRHHNEKKGFQVIFTVKDHTNTVIAQGITPSILTTDDHKTSQASVAASNVLRSPLQMSNIQPTLDGQALYGEWDLSSLGNMILPSISQPLARLSPTPSSNQTMPSSPSARELSPVETSNNIEQLDQLFGLPSTSTSISLPDFDMDTLSGVPDSQSEEPRLDSSPSVMRSNFSNTDLDKLAQLMNTAPPSVPSPPDTTNTSVYTGRKRKLDDSNSAILDNSSFLDFSTANPPDATMAAYPSPSSNLRFSPNALFSSPDFTFGLGDTNQGLISPPEFPHHVPMTLSPQPHDHSLASPDSMIDSILPLTSAQFAVHNLSNPFPTQFSFPHIRNSQAVNSMPTRIPLFTGQPSLSPALAISETSALTLRAARPVISHIIPGESGMSGGIDVACIGTNFSARIAIYIGDERVIFRKDAIAASNIVFVAPPAQAPGTVPVTVVMPGESLEEALLAYDGNDTRVKFTYVQDDDQMLMEQALRILCSQSGRAEDHKAYARNIIESHNRSGSSGHGNDNGSSGNGGGSYNQYSCDEKHLKDIESLFLAFLDRIVDHAEKNKSRPQVVAAALDLPRTNGSTLLSLASGRGYNRATAALLQLGVDVDSRDRCGYTPLMIASRRGHSEVVSTLLNFRSDPFIRNLNGQTALDLAFDNTSCEHLKMWCKYSNPSSRTHQFLYRRLGGKLQMTYPLDRPPFVDIAKESMPDSDFNPTRSLGSLDAHRAATLPESVVSRDETDTGSEGGGKQNLRTMSGLRISRFLESNVETVAIAESSVSGRPLAEVNDNPGLDSTSDEPATRAIDQEENDESWLQRLAALANIRNPFMLPSFIEFLPRRATTPALDVTEPQPEKEHTADQPELGCSVVDIPSKPTNTESPPPYSEACGSKSSSTLDTKCRAVVDATGASNAGPSSSSVKPSEPTLPRMASDLRPLKALEAQAQAQAQAHAQVQSESCGMITLDNGTKSRTVQIQGSKGSLSAADQQQLRAARDTLAARSNDWHLYLFWIPLLIAILYFTCYPNFNPRVDFMTDIQTSLHGFIVRVWLQFTTDFHLPQPLQQLQQQATAIVTG